MDSFTINEMNWLFKVQDSCFKYLSKFCTNYITALNNSNTLQYICIMCIYIQYSFCVVQISLTKGPFKVAWHDRALSIYPTRAPPTPGACAHLFVVSITSSHDCFSVFKKTIQYSLRNTKFHCRIVSLFLAVCHTRYLGRLCFALTENDIRVPFLQCQPQVASWMKTGEAKYHGSKEKKKRIIVVLMFPICCNE